MALDVDCTSISSSSKAAPFPAPVLLGQQSPGKPPGKPPGLQAFVPRPPGQAKELLLASPRAARARPTSKAARLFSRASPDRDRAELPAAASDDSRRLERPDGEGASSLHLAAAKVRSARHRKALTEAADLHAAAGKIQLQWRLRPGGVLARARLINSDAKRRHQRRWAFQVRAAESEFQRERLESARTKALIRQETFQEASFAKRSTSHCGDILREAFQDVATATSAVSAADWLLGRMAAEAHLTVNLGNEKQWSGLLDSVEAGKTKRVMRR
eukprot:TRINITY_DN11105_c0_g1_i1.p1 TRINITY_DN11105_c0_g1~~TRINITY_DN11105_c0_g1_i1.p1  ORF type:complete len:300 (-),score=55.41 TRINITY_DN11105_c0_g1_i1:58-876(-)